MVKCIKCKRYCSDVFLIYPNNSKLVISKKTMTRDSFVQKILLNICGLVIQRKINSNYIFDCINYILSFSNKNTSEFRSRFIEFLNKEIIHMLDNLIYFNIKSYQEFESKINELMISQHQHEFLTELIDSIDIDTICPEYDFIGFSDDKNPEPNLLKQYLTTNMVKVFEFNKKYTVCEDTILSLSYKIINFDMFQKHQNQIPLYKMMWNYILVSSNEIIISDMSNLEIILVNIQELLCQGKTNWERSNHFLGIYDNLSECNLHSILVLYMLTIVKLKFVFNTNQNLSKGYLNNKIIQILAATDKNNTQMSNNQNFAFIYNNFWKHIFGEFLELIFDEQLNTGFVPESYHLDSIAISKHELLNKSCQQFEIMKWIQNTPETLSTFYSKHIHESCTNSSSTCSQREYIFKSVFDDFVFCKDCFQTSCGNINLKNITSHSKTKYLFVGILSEEESSMLRTQKTLRRILS